MEITLYMAITANGYIAKSDDDTSWVCDTDWGQLEKYINESDVVVMGRKTYEFSGKDFPYGNVLNVVLTNNTSLQKDTEKVLYTGMQPKELATHLSDKGYKKILIIGGGITNTSFLKENMIDNLILSIHPLVLGQGIKLFNDVNFEKSLLLIEAKTLDENLVQLRYKINK